MASDNDTGQSEMKRKSEEAEVKSTAIVQYSRMEQPKLFHQLQQNFNIKQPPTNWLHGGTQWYKFMRNASPGKDHQFSSFNMANCFPDLTGEMDVISDSENIKKLLKMAYSEGHLSMMVHRVGNSLLLDDFDIHRHLLRTQRSDWTWLRRFYMETVAAATAREKIILKKNRSRHHLQNQNMLSKFLHYSAAVGCDDRSMRSESLLVDNSRKYNYSSTAGALLPDPLPPQKPEYLRTVQWTLEDIHMLIGNDLPIFGGSTHPCVSLRLQESGKPISVLTGMDYWLDNLMCNVPELAMCYHVDGIVQKYELIKTEDIPNLRESRFSPKLVRDIAQNILCFLKSNATKEGHTYWLFKGQGDDVVKLYDLSTLCGQEEAAPEPGSQQNPFTVPVGILLYRMARNLRQTQGRKKAPTIRKLLQHCLKLLDKHEHAQVVTSAHYLLCDLYVGEDSKKVAMLTAGDAGAEGGEDTDDATDSGHSTETEDGGAELTSYSAASGQSAHTEEKEETLAASRESSVDPVDTGRHDQIQERRPRVCQESLPDAGIGQDPEPEGEGSPIVSVDVPSLKKDARSKRVKDLGKICADPITGGVIERSSHAIEHVAQGLLCLDMSVARYAKTDSQRVDQQAECNPSEAIPLSYDNTSPQCPSYEQVANESNLQHAAHKSQSDARKSERFKALPKDSWHVSSKGLLLCKATVALYNQAQVRFNDGCYGDALRLGRLLLLCHGAVREVAAGRAAEQRALVAGGLLVLADSELMLAKLGDEALARHRETSESLSEDEAAVHTSAAAEINQYDYEWLDEFCDKAQGHLERSVRIYEQALQVAKTCNSTHMANIVKRLANALNELGVFYMNLASQQAGQSESIGLGRRLVEDSSACFQRGIAHFRSLSDSVNIALLLSNRGRLWRLCAGHEAQYVDTGEGTLHRQFSVQERQYFMQALEQYDLALTALGKRDTQPDIWDSITWQLSSTYFTMATTLQDYPPLATCAQEQVEKEVTELMHKALKHCDTETCGARQPTCQYRAATVHHRLASLYHHAYRNQLLEQKKKHLRQLADLHYGKAADLLLQLEASCELLRLQLERVAMLEYQLEGVASATNRKKLLQTTLCYLLSCDSVMPSLASLLSSSDAEPDGFRPELTKLLAILQARLNFILMQLVKTTQAPKKGKPTEGRDAYKAMYAHVLTQGAALTESTELAARVRTMHAILQHLHRHTDSAAANPAVS